MKNDQDIAQTLGNDWAVNDSGLEDVSQRWIVGNVNLKMKKDSKELKWMVRS